jgi:hypothetical protein
MGTNFEAASRRDKSIRYGFGAAAFIFPGTDRTAAQIPRKRQHLMVRTDRTASRTAATNSGHEFLEIRTVRTVRLSMHRFRGC